MDMLSKAKTGYEGLASTLAKVGALNIDYLEQITDRQMESAKFYSDLGVSQLKGVQALDSLKSVKTFSSSSVETGTKATKKVIEDGKIIAALGSSYKDSMVEIIKSLSTK
jgi:phasin family protein